MPYYWEREKVLEYLWIPTKINFHCYYNFTPRKFMIAWSLEAIEKFNLKKEDLIEIQFISTDFKEIYHIPYKFIKDFEKFIFSANIFDLPDYKTKKIWNDIFFEIPWYLSIEEQRKKYLEN